MLESVLPLFTQLALQAVLEATQHWQSGLQRSGWLESAWPFASLNLHGQYLPLNTSSLSCGATAAGCSCRRACKASSTWTCFGSSRSCLLASWSQSFRVSTCCHEFRSWSFKKAKALNLKPCRGTCYALAAAGAPVARASHMISDWLQPWLGVVTQALLYSLSRLQI